MSFFQAYQDQQNNLQGALNAATSQVDELQSDQAMEQQDKYAQQALKSAGLESLIIGAPVAFGAIGKAKDIYKTATEKFEELKGRYESLKAKGQEIKDSLSKGMNFDEIKSKLIGLSPEEIQKTLVSQFGDKLANSPLAQELKDKMAKITETHDNLKASVLDHVDSAEKLKDKLTEAQAEAEALSSGAINDITTTALASKVNAIQAVHDAVNGVSDNILLAGSGFSSDPLDLRTAKVQPDEIKATENLGERPLTVPEMRAKLTTDLHSKFINDNRNPEDIFDSPFMDKLREVTRASNDQVKKIYNETASVKADTPVLDHSLENVKLGYETPARTEAPANVLRDPALLQKYKTAEQRIQKAKNDILSTKEPVELDRLNGIIADSQRDISTTSRLAELAKVAPTEGLGFMDNVKTSARSVFSRMTGQLTEDMPKLPMAGESEGLGSLISKYRQSASDAIDNLKSSFRSTAVGGAVSGALESEAAQSLSKVGGGLLRGVNVAGAGLSIEQLGKHFNEMSGSQKAMDSFQASQIKEVPELASDISRGVQTTVSSISKSAGDQLNAFTDTAKATFQNGLEAMKSKVAELTGRQIGEKTAEVVGEKIGEDSALEIAGESALSAIPVVGEIADVGLGLFSLGEGIKDLFSRRAAAPQAPRQEVQMTQQFGVY